MGVIQNLNRYVKKRAKEISTMANSSLTLHGAEANIAGQKLIFKANVEQQAAWRLYVELNTRIATQPLKPSEGILREAVTSLYNIFDITREILKESGPMIAQGNESLGAYAMQILNDILRPFLTKWHPALADWENRRDSKKSVMQHEKEWQNYKQLRRELETIRKVLLKYCNALQKLAKSSI